MDRTRLFAIFAIALTAGGGLAYGTYNFMQQAPQETVVAVPTRPVVVAAADLPLGTELRGEDLRVIQWPEGTAPESTFSSVSEVTGRGLIASMVRNEVILPAKLAPVEAGAGLPPIIPPGMRAVSVRTNEVIGVAGYVLPGTRVDVLATASPTEQRNDTMSKVVLSNVQVLAAGTRLEQDQEQGRPMQVTVVTLLVTPEQSERLALASTEGKIQLALRNPLDQGAPETPGVRPAVLMGTASPARRPAPRPRPAATVQQAPQPSPEPPPPTIEVIRGDKRVNEVVDRRGQ